MRWATKKQQANNKRNNHYLTLNGEIKSLSQWAEEIGISPRGLLNRLKRGMNIEQALSTPKPKNSLKPNARFTDDEIRKIRLEFKYISAIKLSKIYGISKTSILNICNFKTYTNVT